MSKHGYPNLGFDPAPGDLEAINDLVLAVGTVSSDGTTTKTELDKIGTDDGLWVGKAANAFTDTYSEVPPYLKTALSAMEEASRALNTWHREVSNFQARARRLEEEAAAAARKAGSARSTLDGLPSETTSMSAKELEEHDKDKREKKKACEAAEDELASIRNRAHSLNDEFNTSAAHAASQLRKATDYAPPEPGLFDQLVGIASDMLEGAWDCVTDPDWWKALGDVLADIAMVIGVICFITIFTGGLGWLAVAGCIVAAGALASHAIAMKMGADVTWETLAWDAAGLFAAGTGLAGAKLAGAGRGLVAAGRELRAAEGLVSRFSGMGLNPRTWIYPLSAPSGAVRSLEGFVMSGGGRVAAGVGEVIDKLSNGSGLTLAGGSNIERWFGDSLSKQDIPVLGPILDYMNPPDKYDDNYDDTDLVGPPKKVDPPVMLSSAGDSFLNGLKPASGGVVVA
ncbi:putative T7SS-secreted protein [Streptomyces sp. NPDC093065]|uniref:putative T7SS-secreted protein n=1 Tax=Streptomyces sp. NPDC093065 TaxID=3366021 RepID=UPI00382811E2